MPLKQQLKKEGKSSINNSFVTRQAYGDCVISTPCAVLVSLDSSQIYEDHAVIGTGYITFAHSSGWQSKYLQIFDQWNYNLRYVNYQLGINYIIVREVYAEDIGVNAPPIPTPVPRP